MTYRAPMRISVITVVLFAAAMAVASWPTCSWSQSEGQATFTPLIQQNFDARSGPAKATSDDETALKSKGYFKIGTIHATQPGKKGNQEITRQLESAILQKAAQAGGDFVHFSREGAFESENVPTGKTRTTGRTCLESGSQSVYTPTTTHSCTTDIHGFTNCSNSTSPGYSMGSTCVRWSPGEVVSVTKRETSLVSEGTVWRYDTGILLFKAVAAHQVEGLKLALKQGVPVNSVDAVGFMVLQRALMENQPELVQTLLDNGADVNAAIKSGAKAGITPLMMASAASTSWVEPLLMRGAKIDATDKNGMQAFAYAVAGGNVEVIKLLASHGANLNWQSEHGETYLMLAAETAQGESAKALIELGANRSLKDKDGRTAAAIAKLTMAQLVKEDSFTKDLRLRWSAIEAILYASEDRDRQGAILSSAQEWLTHVPNDPDAYLWLARGYYLAPSDFTKAAEN